ncbi:nucleotidyltransferase family protein [Aliarcobacter skirrowii]|uniref:nucleotidyltransferase family protein n=1 Tax=Aliarcobacter skirrowii TaxID=28200 RepID=UPI0029BE411F|nr:nucleotidyltransferase family protein [Aliarcobacter skirrowii]MDX4059300.1 nucleotidyltransferase family protein [Aliarcobacter skirrowii]
MNFKKYCHKLSNLKIFDDVLVALEQTGVGSLVVIDETSRLVGLITDGDIRRALLKKETNIEAIINKKPEAWLDTQSRQAGINHMKKIHRNILPIVDKENKLVDVLCLDEISFDTIDNPVVIMAGGLGTRLYPLTKETPKPMLLINGKPILERIIEKLITQGFQNFYISINYLGEQIKEYFKDGSKWDISIKYIEETKKLGTAGALFQLKKMIHKPLIVMNGDIITDLDFRHFLTFHQEMNSLSTMCLSKQIHQVPFGVVEFDNNFNIVSMKEKPKHEYYVNMGIYVVSPEVLHYIPENEYYDMPTLFQNLINDKKNARVFVFDGLWNDIGRVEDYKSANSIIN